MNTPAIIVAVLGIVASAGGITAYFARSRGTETIKLLLLNIQAYKDSETLKDAKILVLQNQIIALRDVIEVRDKTIQRIINNEKD